MRKPTRAHRGFTLIELLVVIAIIAVLAAILFPVFAQVREKTRQTTCMANLHNIYTAVHQYYLDNQKFPPTLYAYATIANTTPPTYYTGSGTPLPMNAVQSGRYLTQGQKYLKANDVFICPDNMTLNTSAVTTAVYPQNVPLAGQQVMLNGNPAWFYKADAYDTGFQTDAQGNQPATPVVELHYSLDWTGVTGLADPTNQLKYPDPPLTKTVITWCMYHVTTAHTRIVPVLMGDGSVKPAPLDQFIQKGPLNFRE